MEAALTFVEQSCAYCGGSGVVMTHVTRSLGCSDDLLVIEKIPLWLCSTCRESYFTAQTMHEVERIKVLRKSLAVENYESVAEFKLNAD
jgi:YgiT-type zinc finger domain-containing protein